MLKPIKVVIGGRELSLVGDDSGIIEASSKKVDAQMEKFRNELKINDYQTLTLLTALNLAEENIMLKQDNEIHKQKTIEEIKKIASHLRQAAESN